MYKTILVHVDASKRSALREEAAARLALSNEAHLVGTALTGLTAFMLPATMLDGGMVPIEFPVEELRAGAGRMLDQFDSRARAMGVQSFERRCVDDDVGNGLCLQARYADLLVISQLPPGESTPYVQPDFPQFVALNSPRPVLVLPALYAGGEIGRSVTVAWNGSTEAVHAIASALPLLRRAERVDLLVILNGDHADHGEQPGADMALYLARQGVKVEVVVLHSDDKDGEQLLSFAADQGSDLIVMGAFGRSRLREFVMGGFTRTALRTSPVALWMAH